MTGNVPSSRVQPARGQRVTIRTRLSKEDAMTDLTEDNPRDSRATITRSLELHRQFWEQMIEEFDKPEGESRVRVVTYASLGTLHTAVALEWVARKFGRDAADDLSEVFYRYAADGEDYEGLFEGLPGFEDTSITLIETPPKGPVE